MKATPFVIASDNHGDQGDPDAIAALFAFVREFNPKIRIHAGDLFDFRRLRTGASQQEAQERMGPDIMAGFEFMEGLFSSARNVNVFLRGNHDERLWMRLDDYRGNVAELAEIGVQDITSRLRKYKTTMLPYDARLGVYELGHLSVLHGYHTGVSACRKHADVYGNCVFGHIHSIENQPVPSRIQAEARSIGCLCRHDMDYIRTKTAQFRWEHGWAYGWLFDDGKYVLNQARKIGNKYHAVTKLQTY